MKLKKIKIKKPNKNHRTIQDKVDAMNNLGPRKTTKFIKLFILGTSLLFFALSTLIFGIWIALGFTIFYLLMILLVRKIDKYPNGSRKRKRAKNLFMIILLFGIICILAFIVFFIIVIIASPNFEVEKLNRNETTIIYDNKNETITTLGNEKREKLEYDELPNVLVDAIVATEDSRFFQHNGFDAPRFTKAVIGQLAHGSDAGGGSTLTMQVSKNNFTSRDAEGIKGIIRKFTDIYLSIFKIERAFTKQEIIEYYVNEPFLGSNSYGVEQASQTYFGKHAKELNLSEASLIAGLFQAPGAYDPYANPDAAQQRRSTVLSLMLRHGYITQEEKEIAESIPVKKLVTSSKKSSTNTYQDYIDLVVDEIVNKTGMDPYVTPMIVYTNMDKQKQNGMNKVFSGKTYTWVNSTIQGGAVAIESKTGKIIAVGAGRNRTGERTFNYATDIKRQIGSTAKPLFDYGPAIEYENWSTGHILNDKPWTYTGTSQKIVNYDGRYLGNISLRYALSDSRNVPAVQTFQSVDNEKIKKFVTGLGITPETDSTGYLHEAHALGAFNGASPLEIARAYAAFSNGGTYYEAYSVNKIILRDSDEKIEFKAEGEKAMSDATAYMITNVLMDVPGMNNLTGLTTDQFAMKTGTTNYDTETARKLGYSSDAAPDGWVAGYTPTISLAAWTGYIENKKGVYLTMSEMYNHKNNLYRALAKQIFDNNGDKWKKPSSVVRVKLEKGTEKLASSYTPKSMIVTELFKRGTVPKVTSTAYNKLDNPNNLTISYSGGTVTLEWSAAKEPKNSNSSMGAFGYYIYLNGKTLGFTTGTSYSYSGSSPFGTYTVRTSYKNSTTNMSSGISKTLSQSIKIESNVSPSIDVGLGGTFTPESNPFTVYENGVDVTAAAKIDYTIYDADGNQVNEINTEEAGTYKIVYNVTYDGKSDSAETTINVG